MNPIIITLIIIAVIIIISIIGVCKLMDSVQSEIDERDR